MEPSEYLESMGADELGQLSALVQDRLTKNETWIVTKAETIEENLFLHIEGNRGSSLIAMENESGWLVKRVNR